MLLSYTILDQLSFVPKPVMLKGIAQHVSGWYGLLAPPAFRFDSGGKSNNLTVGCVSKLKAVEYDYTWKIENFHYWPESSKNDLEAPEFTIKILDRNLKCKIKVGHDLTVNRYNGPTYVVTDDLNLNICFNYSQTFGNIQVLVKISVLNDESNVYKKFQNWYQLDNPDNTTVNWNRFLRHSAIMIPQSNLLSDNALTILFEFVIPTEIDNTLQKKNQVVHPIESECRIISDLENLLKGEKFSDFTITASCGKKFRVHKAILAARSNVFAAMFDSNMLEKSENNVNISDIDGKTMHEVLRFIYTGKTDLRPNNAIEMIQAAEKYELEDLKRKCESIICESITIENVVEIFVIAHLHNAIQLENKCLNFMSENQEEVIKTSGFKTLATRRDPALSQILLHFGK